MLSATSDFIKSIKAHAILPGWGWIPKPNLVKAVCETEKYQILQNVASGALPAYPHQKELIESISAHLGSSTRESLMIGYQTPTGSGKTFSFLLLQHHLKKNFPDTVVIMGAPSTLISRAVHEMEGQRESNYWSMFLAENGEYQVLRPYSSMKNVRREKTKWQGCVAEDDEQFKGKKTNGNADEIRRRDPTLTQQFYQAETARTKAGDSVPNVILADIFAIRKLMQELDEPVAHEKIKMPKWLRKENMVLFIDEPNMGIFNPEIQSCMQEILIRKPFVTILASATLGDWGTIPAWWRGSPGQLQIISSSPFEQPCLKLLRTDEEVMRTHELTPLDLCQTPDELKVTMSQLNPRQHAAIMRYFTKGQIVKLTDAVPDAQIAVLRENHLLPLLHNPHADMLTRLEKDKTGEQYTKIRNVLSKTGMSLVAAFDPYKTAMELCGYKTQEEYFEAKHTMQSKVRNAIAAEAKRLKALEKASKSKRRGDDDGYDEEEPSTTRVKIGRAELTISELEEIMHDNDIDTMLFLENGIVINTSSANRTARQLFQRAVLSLPEKMLDASTKRPAIHCLVTDYSGIFGIDCAGIRRVIILDDLAKFLSQDDIIQATGRVRRDGQIMVMSTVTAAKLLAFPDHDWTHLATQTITNKLSQMPQSSIQEQRLILRELHAQSFAGVIYTPDELVFKVFLNMASRPECKQCVRSWTNGVFDCNWDFKDIAKYMQMFQKQKSHPTFMDPLAALIYMYNVLDFDLVSMQGWIRENATPDELKAYRKFLEFIEESSDEEDSGSEPEK
jgi:hypothetical protein